VPAAPLRPYVAWYAGYRQRGLAPARHRGLPSPHLTLIFTLDEPMTMAVHPNPGQPPGEFGTLLGGLHRTPALIVHEGAQSGIQLALRPLGTRLLLGLPAGELAGIDVPAETVLGGVGAELHDRVRRASGWRERFAILALAAETGWSSRHLTSRFRTEIGLTPKAAARVIRFTRTRQLLSAQADAGQIQLAELAVTCGYFDQAHLAREFRTLAGCPPSRWLAEEKFRNVQAAGALAEPAWTDSAW
jgi:AraC-like DNA-binding protein